MKKNARPIETDRNEPSDNSAFEEQKSRISSCAEQIVRANSPGEIAKIAAFLMRDGRDEIEATRTALRLLELAHCALFDLRQRGDIESGVARCKRNWADYEAIQRAEASIPAYRYETDEKGNLLPVPFDEGLRVLMPRLKREDRIKNLRTWIASQYEPRRFAIQAQQLRSLLGKSTLINHWLRAMAAEHERSRRQRAIVVCLKLHATHLEIDRHCSRKLLRARVAP